MLLNAEGLPIEGIDKITVTLNPLASCFITTEKPYTDNTHYIRLDQVFYFGKWAFLTIQSQRIDHTLDIRCSIAKAIYELIEKKILVFPIDIPLIFIYMKLDYFVYNIKEIEFYFDFIEENIHILQPELLNQIGTSYYSSDYRSSRDFHTRKSLLEVYDHAKNLERINQTSRKKLKENQYTKRIEFNLTKYNTRNMTLSNLSGNYDEVISRYTHYLAVLYSRYFYGNVIVNDFEHYHFNKIYQLAAKGQKRYTGNELEKVSKKENDPEIKNFWNKKVFLHYENTQKESNNSAKLVEKALKN